MQPRRLWLLRGARPLSALLPNLAISPSHGLVVVFPFPQYHPCWSGSRHPFPQPGQELSGRFLSLHACPQSWRAVLSPPHTPLCSGPVHKLVLHVILLVLEVVLHIFPLAGVTFIPGIRSQRSVLTASLKTWGAGYSDAAPLSSLRDAGVLSQPAHREMDRVEGWDPGDRERKMEKNMPVQPLHTCSPPPPHPERPR